MLHVSLKNALLRSTMLVGAAALAVPSLAQEAPGNPTPGVPATTAAGTTTSEAVAPADSAEDKEITVTGSLIKNPNLVRSAPVLVTTAEEIQLRQSNTAEEVLREIPGIVPSIGNAVNNGNGGASFVDLRGLGANRNLVLLNGNRLVPADTTGAVDLNNIPLALIDRVETLTGGASTTYGADAVSGVVNFITKQNFTGVDLNVSEQITEKGDGNIYRADLTVGGNFADDKGNAVLSVGYQRADAVYQGDRSFSQDSISSFTGGVGGSGTAIPSRFTGTRPIDPATGQPSIVPGFSGFDANNEAIPIVGGFVNGGTRQILPSTGAAIDTYQLFNFAPYNIFQTPFKRYNIFAQARYDISDNVEAYTRGLFSKNVVQSIVAPSGVFGSTLTIPLSNPYLPATLRNQFCAFNVAEAVNGVQTTYTPRFTPAECAAAAVATDPTDPNFKTVDANVSRRITEAGPRISEFVTTVFDYRAGFRGSFSSHIDWDVNGAYGQSQNTQTLNGYILTSRARQATLATNTTTCTVDSNGCVPLNLFGPLGSISQAQADYLTARSTSTNKTSLGQFHAGISGDFGFSSPAASDPISFALGVEYRNYHASQSSDLLAQTAGELGGAGGALPDIDGGYNVKEVFGELVVPLIQDKPGFESLTLEAGGRYSEYRVNAPGNPKFTTTTYKGGASWEPGAGLKLRGNYSHAVRAPNIGELFSPTTTGLTNLSVDPCAGSAPVSDANLRAVCIAQGAPAGTIGSIINPSAQQANATSGGNLLLKPETANTYGGGVIFQPRAVPGVALTVDYYHIKVTNAISTPTSGDAIAACFANLTATSFSDAACTAIGRNPLSGGLDGDPATTRGVPLPLSNSGRIATDGIDASLNISHDIGFAKLGVSATGNYTFHSKFQSSPSALNRECVGFYSVNCAADGGFLPGSIQPKWQTLVRTTFSFDKFDLSLLWRHIDKMKFEPAQSAADIAAAIANGCGDPTGEDPDGCVVNPEFTRIKSYNYFDLTSRISVLENLSVTLTVQNLANKKPPQVGTGIGSTYYNSGNTYPSTYDALGRRYAVSANVTF